MRGLTLIATAGVGLALGVPASAQGWVELHRLWGDFDSSDFGCSCALTDGVLLVGDYGDDGNGPLSGAAHLFDPVTGVELVELQPTDSGAGDRFGEAVAIDGSLALVGAPGNTDAGPESGSVYVFDVASGLQLWKLLPGDLATQDGFGCSVAIDGTVGLVGAYRNGGKGAAYLFDLTTGQQLAKLVARTGAVDDWFGSSVALGGNTILVGAPGDDDNGPQSGSVCVFDASTAAQLAKLDHGWSYDYFGRALAIDGSTAVIGSDGAAYVYDLASLSMTTQLHGSGAASEDLFGWAVDVHGTIAIVGANCTYSEVTHSELGAAYLFETSTGAQLGERILGTDCFLAAPHLGYSVAVHGDLAIAGAPGCGYAGVYDLSLATAASYCEGSGCPCGNDFEPGGCTNSTGFGAWLVPTGTAHVSSDDLVLSTHSLPPNQFGLFFAGGQETVRPFGDGLFCVTGGLVRFGPPLNSGAGGSLSLGPGIVASSCTLGSCITPGSTWYFQTWYRDIGGPCGSTSNLSNAVRALFLP